MLNFDNKGIYCKQAGVYIDPWGKVDRAIITHAHSDHARWGSKHYLAHHHSVPILRLRLGANIDVHGVAYSEVININGVNISLHPAGHIIGSAQVRLEYKGEIWVVSGDYKLQHDGVSAPFEPVKCHHFVTESTFGMPMYRFPKPETVHDEMNQWCRDNQAAGKNSIIIGYALGKAQRILKNLDATIGDIYVHGAVANINDALVDTGMVLPEIKQLAASGNKKDIQGAIIVAPPSATGSPWLNRFEPYNIAVCSGWMQLRGARRRGNVDRGFVLSDHSDWEQLNTAVLATTAENVYVTHGYKSIFARWLREEHGLNATEVDTLYEGENIAGEKEDVTIAA